VKASAFFDSGVFNDFWRSGPRAGGQGLWKMASECIWAWCAKAEIYVLIIWSDDRRRLRWCDIVTRKMHLETQMKFIFRGALRAIEVIYTFL